MSDNTHLGLPEDSAFYPKKYERTRVLIRLIPVHPDPLWTVPDAQDSKHVENRAYIVITRGTNQKL